jgi:hypothetical protein
MLIIFFRHPRHCPQGIRTPWSNRQWQVLLWGLERLREGIRLKRPNKWKNNNWFLRHDNAPAHTSVFVRQFLTSKNITVIPHPHPPIRLTSPPATFFYSTRWNYGWKGAVLTRLRRCTQNRKRLSTHSHFRTSRDAWNHGKHAGIAVYMPKGLLRKMRWKLGVTVRKFFMVKFPGFLDSTSLYIVKKNYLCTTCILLTRCNLSIIIMAMQCVFVWQ